MTQYYSCDSHVVEPSVVFEGLGQRFGSRAQPGAYFQRQFYATFEDDAIGVLTRHFIGVDNLIWGNDYRHHDSSGPIPRKSSRASSRVYQGMKKHR